jgi:Na+-transporting methylmalonyl-CoA/oxaloacetate decarboxylase gamma subunit
VTSYAHALIGLGLVVAVAGFGVVGIVLAVLGCLWEVYATNAAR